MADLNLFERLRKRFYWNRLHRLSQHYKAIKNELRPRGAAVEEAKFFMHQFERYGRRTSTLMNIRLFFYFILYAALLVNIFKLIPLLSFLVTFIELGSAVFGTTVVVGVIFLLTLRINLNLELMQDCLTHLIVIYHNNPKRKTKDVLATIAKAI